MNVNLKTDFNISFDMINQVLNCQDAAKIIFSHLSIAGHINLTKAMTDNYILHLLSLSRQRRQSYFRSGFARHSIAPLKDQTLDCLDKGYWKHISLFAKMEEDFITKWSHKMNFRFLRLNSRGGHFKKGYWTPRVFSRKFHRMFPGYKNYQPCNLFLTLFGPCIVV